MVEALLAKGADVETKDNVSIARACALCPSRSLTHVQNAHGCPWLHLGGYHIYVPCCLSRRRYGSKA